jgi:biopolymer transport protein ExbD
MSMSAGGATGGLQNEPNVTPMIDVLLVLLIIFMMVIPMSRRAIDLQLPDPRPSTAPVTDNKQIVLEILPGGQFAINKKPVSKADLPGELKTIFDGRPDKIMFFKGDPTVTYQEVIWSMDVARGAGVKVLGVAPKDKPAA